MYSAFPPHLYFLSHCYLHSDPLHQTDLQEPRHMQAHTSHSPYCTHSTPDKRIFCSSPYHSSPMEVFHSFYLHNRKTQQMRTPSVPTPLSRRPIQFHRRFRPPLYQFHLPFHPMFPQPSANTPTPTHMYSLSDCLPEAVRRDRLRIRRYMPLRYNVRQDSQRLYWHLPHSPVSGICQTFCLPCVRRHSSSESAPQDRLRQLLLSQQFRPDLRRTCLLHRAPPHCQSGKFPPLPCRSVRPPFPLKRGSGICFLSPASDRPLFLCCFPAYHGNDSPPAHPERSDCRPQMCRSMHRQKRLSAPPAPADIPPAPF